ncbi:MAG: pyridoxal-phosphate dependent enzyme [Chloroflexota bacterium]|nr:pyridoxal-phosphate dependent enzyme [Chloroflexota bacterium]
MALAGHRLLLARIERAVHLIDPVFLRSPQFESESLSDQLGVRVILKVETANPIRSFKGRGAEVAVASVAPGATLICASAGNFGQAMAFACRKRGVPLAIYASVNANPLKVDRMRALGATVVLEGEDFDAAKLAAKREAARSGATMIEDSLDPGTAEGAGTIALELLDLPEPLDAMAVPLGNGALLAGVGRVLKERWPATRIVAVQAAGAPAMIESWRSGSLVRHNRIATIADGIGVREPVPEALDDVRDLIDDGLLVSEASIIAAMKLLHRHAGLVVEPSGAVGIAAMLEHPPAFAGKRTGTIICGGNLTEQQMRDWLES